MATGTTGRNLLLKIGDGGDPTESFTTIAALTESAVPRSNPIVDTTSKDDGGNRTLLEGKNLLTHTVTATGVFVDSATISSLVTDMEAGTLRNFEIDIASTAFDTNSGETLTGAFQVTSLDVVGGHSDAITYSFTLESSGAVTSS